MPAFLLLALLLLVPTARTQTPSAQTFTETPDSLVVPSGTLYGTLTMPAGAAGPVPVALIIAGSGPTDRDGNQRGTGAASLRLLAHALAERGVATLRTDKRGVGQSAAAYRLTDLFDAFVGDAEAWLAHLRADPQFSTVSVVGHSEGALIGALAGADGRADALVSVAGAGEPIAAVLRRQLSERLPEPMRPGALALVDSLEAGRLVPEPPGVMAQVFPLAVQPFLVSWMAYNPAAAVAAFCGPVLVAQGTTDVQVTVADAERLAAAPGVRLLLVAGMNHVLKDVSGDLAAQMPSYTDPALPVNAELVREMAAFLLTVE